MNLLILCRIARMLGQRSWARWIPRSRSKCFFRWPQPLQSFDVALSCWVQSFPPVHRSPACIFFIDLAPQKKKLHIRPVTMFLPLQDQGVEMVSTTRAQTGDMLTTIVKTVPALQRPNHCTRRHHLGSRGARILYLYCTYSSVLVARLVLHKPECRACPTPA